MEEIVLNRLDITGVLNEKTPYCVIQEIMKSHNISMNKIDTGDIKFVQFQKDLSKINSYRPITLMGSLEKNLRYVATFVNPDCKTWTQRSLTKSFEHMFNFPKDNLDILKSISYGQKDRDNIEAFNVCMLYALCKKYGIETHWKMTPEQMVNLIQKLTIDTNKLRTSLIPLIESLNKSQLVNIYALLDQTPKKNIPLMNLPDKESKMINESKGSSPMVYLDNEKLAQHYKKFTDINYLVLTVQPRNHFEAIVLSAMIYNINITESRFPLLEFEELNEVKNLDLYVPVDSIFRKKYLYNKSWYNLLHHWCPELSFIYSKKELMNFCSEEGYSPDDFRNFDPNNLLHMSRISMNIYLGKNVYNIDQEYTPIHLHDLSEIPNTNCLTFGVVSETSSLKTYSIDEICDMFMIHKNYIHPELDKERLPEKVIKKLHGIANQLNNMELLKAISVVEKWKQYSNEFSESLRTMYKENPTIVVSFLSKVMECGLYMRGWKVVCEAEAYPLSEDQTKLCNTDFQFKIEEKVFEAIQELKTYLDSEKVNEEERNVFKSLPLMKFSHEGDTKIFVLTPDPEDGTSILHRLDIVLDGNKYKNMKSCIRLSSNIILHSVYFYTCSLGLSEPFNIFELENIT
jgi:hypothetical protein